MKRLRFFVALFTLSLSLNNVFAAVVDDLYTVELPVADQTTSLRLQAFQQAFSKVIIKVSGSDAALQVKAFKKAKNNASRYVKEFQYVRKQAELDAIEEDRLFLKVEFSQKLIESLLRGHGLPIWGKVRPSVLIVMSEQVNRNSQLVAEESTPDTMQNIDDAALSYGLPVQFPLLDLEDLAILKNATKNLIALDSANELGKRYQSDVVLVGELVGTSGQGWKGTWQSQFSGHVYNWKFTASDKQTVIDKSLAYLARLLAKEYALGSVQENQNTVLIKVESISSLDQFLTVSRYFSKLAVVKNVQAKHIDENSADFYLTLRNSPDELHRLIELGGLIEQVDLPVIDTTIGDNETDKTNDLLSFTYRLL